VNFMSHESWAKFWSHGGKELSIRRCLDRYKGKSNRSISIDPAIAERPYVVAALAAAGTTPTPHDGLHNSFPVSAAKQTWIKLFVAA
jgi:hypothetical protein